MSVEKVMEILNQYETRAAQQIHQDNALNIDNYESVGKYRLVKKIRKQIKRELSINDDKEAA